VSVLSLPVVLPRSPSPCRQPFCIFLSARFLWDAAGRGQVGLAARRPPAAPPARLPACPPAVVLEALLEPPPLLLRGLPAARALLQRSKAFPHWDFNWWEAEPT
jgi:hypothetical protein